MEFSAAKSVGNSEKYICLSMKNRSNTGEPAAHSSIMSGKQLLQAHKRTSRSVCEYLCVRLYICIHPHACTRGRTFMHVNACVRWRCCDSHLDNVCYHFPSRHLISHPETANGNVFLFFPPRSVTGRWPPCGLH